MSKSGRHFAIKQIISQQIVSSQDDLCVELEKTGIEITQATLSRDLKEMGIYRVNTPTGLRYIIPTQSDGQQLRSLVSYEVENIQSNEAMVVVKTLPGRAQGVAEIIDSLKNPDILGTLAGDNTVFIAPVSVIRIYAIVEAINKLIMGE